ncbi:MAG: TatD family hydrolase [Owenweeksia sp.]
MAKPTKENTFAAMIDTHSHIYLKDFAEDRAEMLHRAREAGVEKVYLPNIDSSSMKDLKALAESEPNCLPMMGLHPGSVKENWEEELNTILSEIDQNPDYYKAIGEIGMDLYWDKTFVKEQEAAFALQIEKALELKLPIVIHCREAFDEIFAVLENYRGKGLYGIFHCFTGTLEQAQQAIDLGLKLGIGGIVTFKNGGLDKVVEQLNPRHIVLETDAPYLAPDPKRGKRNEPSYLAYTAQKVADLLLMPLEELEQITNRNAKEVFRS